ncbi:MAG: hypothetical protein LBV68_01300 [Spirochaetaceae bacterium]|jgi:hypothetical protein|nr:hypothetical protein [Spirochaetaceae bacterium]
MQKTIEIKADRLLHLDLPLPDTFESGVASVELTITPIAKTVKRPKYEMFPPQAHSVAEALTQGAEKVAARRADPSHIPFGGAIGSVKNAFGGDGVAYQRKIRDEWN